MNKLSLSRREIIKRKKEVEGVFSSGKAYRGDFLTLRIESSKESSERPKFAFLLAKKIKGAVRRNRIKRLMREVVRQKKKLFSPGDKVIVIASPQAQDKSMREFQLDFSNLLSEAGMNGEAD